MMQYQGFRADGYNKMTETNEFGKRKNTQWCMDSTLQREVRPEGFFLHNKGE